MIKNRPQQPLKTPRPDHRRRPVGAVVGLVTNNTDPEAMGRVKVRFPWLHDDVESHWARIAQPYAGPGRGAFWLPEVGDEVCVVFDRGDPNHPYILGGIWNGWDTPPEPGNPDGKDDTKIWKTRNGHELRFEDHPGGERITLADGPSNRTLVIDVASDTITLSSSPGDMTWEAPQEHIKLECVTLDIAVTRDSTWTIDTALTEQCTDRVENIGGPDHLTVGQNWSMVTKNGTMAAAQSTVSFEQAGHRVTGGMAFTTDSRTLNATTVRRRSAPETTTAQKLTIKADDTVTSVVNGATSIQHDSLSASSKDAVVAGGPSTSILGGSVNIASASSLSTLSPSVSIGQGGPTQPGPIAERKKEQIQFKVLGRDGEAMAHMKYECTLADGTKRSGSLDASGAMQIAGVTGGTAKINFPEAVKSVFDAHKKAMAEDG